LEQGNFSHGVTAEAKKFLEFSAARDKNGEDRIGSSEDDDSFQRAGDHAFHLIALTSTAYG
jgi:hypothetical protein